MHKIKVKEFIKMMTPDTKIMTEYNEVLTQDQYEARYGELFVVGFWSIGKNLIGIYEISEEEFDYWKERFEKC